MLVVVLLVEWDAYVKVGWRDARAVLCSSFATSKIARRMLLQILDRLQPLQRRQAGARSASATKISACAFLSSPITF